MPFDFTSLEDTAEKAIASAAVSTFDKFAPADMPADLKSRWEAIISSETDLVGDTLMWILTRKKAAAAAAAAALPK